MITRTGRWAVVTSACAVLLSCTTVLPPQTATLSPSPTPGAATLGPTPTQTGSPQPTQPTEAPTGTPDPTASPTLAPTPSPTATSPVTEWTGPVEVSDNRYQEISVVVDEAGLVHAAGSLNRSAWYVTNAGGKWTRERLSTPRGSGNRAPRDIEPAIARDGDHLWVAFTRLGEQSTFGALPEHVYYVDGSANTWSEPVEYGPLFGNNPSIQVRDGQIHLAYLEGVPFDVVEEGFEFPLRYATNRTGSWTDVEVSPNGTDPTLHLTSNGRARIAFGDFIDLLPTDGLRYAVAGSAADDFAVETVPGTASLDFPHSMALDARDRAHLIWGKEDDVGVHYARRGRGGWSTPQALLSEGSAISLAVATDADDAVHVVATTVSHGVWYFTDRHGAFESRQLLPPAAGDTWFAGSCDIAVDPTGRAHILFLVGRGARSTTLYYAASPAG